ncbi:hypothetical protein L3Y34_019584 [Caenorhabditis briggsae]|uniref:Uncharacterized protein n=1 Tax=Caenorhabditis briggsae TaxID=6238 RepID=A0AAE9DPC4_CAEBR|nr:hypothetical protein L3Y34_019584 [Caenorhabditis briggsae]
MKSKETQYDQQENKGHQRDAIINNKNGWDGKGEANNPHFIHSPRLWVWLSIDFPYIIVSTMTSQEDETPSQVNNQFIGPARIRSKHGRIVRVGLHDELYDFIRFFKPKLVIIDDASQVIIRHKVPAAISEARFVIASDLHLYQEAETIDILKQILGKWMYIETEKNNDLKINPVKMIYSQAHTRIVDGEVQVKTSLQFQYANGSRNIFTHPFSVVNKRVTRIFKSKLN